MNITLIYCTEKIQKEFSISTRKKLFVIDAIKKSSILLYFHEINLSKNKVGIYGKLVELDQIVKNNDRIEIYRPLSIDPKKARRVRARKHKI